MVPFFPHATAQISSVCAFARRVAAMRASGYQNL